MIRARSPYSAFRGGDSDAGGAADLQTDVMRFMAILALCLVAIFALVQSLPMTNAPQPETLATPIPEPVAEAMPESITTQMPEPVAATSLEPAETAEPRALPPLPEAPASQTPQQKVVRPERLAKAQVAAPEPKAVIPTASKVRETANTAEAQGFSLRFDSDRALTRLVAENQVGVYALSDGHSKRLSIRESRISFWDASAPSRFHEMQASTVPKAISDALRQSGSTASTVDWAVTLPPKLWRQIDSTMQQHRGGVLVIEANGNVRREEIE